MKDKNLTKEELEQLASKVVRLSFILSDAYTAAVEKEERTDRLARIERSLESIDQKSDKAYAIIKSGHRSLK